MDPALLLDAVALPLPGVAASEVFTIRVDGGELLVLEGAGLAVRAVLLRAAAGLIPPRAGRLRILGQDPGALPRAAREALAARLGYLPRRGELISNISLEANLLLPLRYHLRLRLAEARRQGALAAARFGLAWPLPAALPAEVPPGVHRRVALARAVVLSPELLLLEGFTDDLSRPDAAALCAAVRDWAAERGAAVLAATDDPSLAGRLGARRQLLEA